MDTVGYDTVGYTVFASGDMEDYDIPRLIAMAFLPNDVVPPPANPANIQVVASQVDFHHAAHLVNTLRVHGVEDWHYDMLPHSLFLMLVGNDEWHDYVPLNDN